MNVKGMNPCYTYTDNHSGIKIDDYINVQQKIRQEHNVKFTLPKRDTYYSTDKFVGVPLTYTSDAAFRGVQLAFNNVVKPVDSIYKTSDIESSNQVDFRSGEWITLGEYNGVTVKLKINGHGFLDNNLGIPEEFASKPGQPENAFEKKVTEMNRKISDSQHTEIGNIMGAFREFLDVADDKVSISSIDEQHHKNLILGLEKMGVDLSKPFAINGEEFYLRNDTGKIDYYNVKKYVIREDGHVEIRDARDANPSDIWKKLAEKYDVRNASFDEIKEISRQLYNEGQITGFECAMLTFDPSESPQALNSNIFLTQVDADDRRDWIAEYETRLSRDMGVGDQQSYKINQRTLEILKSLL